MLRKVTEMTSTVRPIVTRSLGYTGSISPEDDTPYLGTRGPEFRSLIKNILNKALKPDLVSMLTSTPNIGIYSQVFTSADIDTKCNYEYYEQMGDVIIGQFIVWYMYRRFPRLRCQEGVKVVARLRINCGSRDYLSNIADELGFWPFISALQSKRDTMKKPCLEDVFEAFIGGTADILDNSLGQGAGYIGAYKILENIFDAKDISLKYTDLFDKKTQCKELQERFKAELGPKLIYINTRNQEERITESIVYRFDNNGRKIELGRGRAPAQADAEQRAAEVAVKLLNSQGYIKPVSAIYD